MTLYEKNLKTLEKYYSGIRQNIQTAQEQIIEDFEVCEEISEDGQRILKVKKDQHFCYLGGKRNALEPPHEWLQEQGNIPEGFYYILLGLGNVGYLRELIENVDVKLNIIIYEPSIQIFLKALDMIDLQKGMEKHFIVFWVEGVGGMTALKFNGLLEQVMRVEVLKNLQLFILPNYDVIFKSVCDEIIKQCEKVALNKKVSYNTSKAFAPVTSINVMKNAKHLCTAYKTIQLFQAIPMEIPGIVVAAGPSLNKNIKELKKAKGKAFIIAVDTALKPLLQEGIVPDMFFIVDAQKPIDLVKMEKVDMIPMVTTLNANPEILDYHKGMKFFYDESYSFAEKILLRSGLSWGDVCTGGSVATNAFSLLYKIGLKTIILVGQDLAMTGNRTHADGTFEEKMPEIDTSNCEWVSGNYEEKVPTRTDFKVFLNWYETSIPQYKEHVEGFRVINATEGGAKIEGTEIKTLTEAIQEVCTKEVDIRECLSKIPSMLNENDCEWAKNYLREIPQRFGELQKQAKQLKKFYEKIEKLLKYKKIDVQKYKNLCYKISRKNKQIENYDEYQLVILTMPSAAVILREEEFSVFDSIETERKEIIRKGKLYADLIYDASRLLKEEAEKIYKDW